MTPVTLLPRLGASPRSRRSPLSIPHSEAALSLGFGVNHKSFLCADRRINSKLYSAQRRSATESHQHYDHTPIPEWQDDGMNSMHAANDLVAYYNQMEPPQMSMMGNFLAVSESELNGCIENIQLLEERMRSVDDDDENYGYVDKAWQAIHFILTKNPWEGEAPESLVILGGKEIGEDFGYGPGTYLTSSEVKMVSKFLDKVDVNKLKSEFNRRDFVENEIYPTGIWATEGDEALNYIVSYLESLIEFYRNAANNDRAVIKYIN